MADSSADPYAASLAEDLVVQRLTYAVGLGGVHGITFRVAEEDGERFALTMDWSPKRINLVVRDCVILRTCVG